MYQPEQPVFDQAIESNIEITYGIEDVPKPWWKSLYFAVQITLVDFTPFVWGGMFVSLAGLDAATVLPTMISACFLVMGICTLIQTTIGNRLPIVQGPSASLASSMGSVAATYGLPAVWGSVIVGGALETLLGGARIMSKIRKFLPPVVVGSVVAAIGYVAARIAVQWTFSSQDAKSLIMAAVAFLLALVLKFRGGSCWRLRSWRVQLGSRSQCSLVRTAQAVPLHWSGRSERFHHRLCWCRYRRRLLRLYCFHV